jgi:hypothetical protein
VSDLLALTGSSNPADPRRHAALSASLALFANYPGERGPQSILEASLDGVDRVQLYPALQALLSHEDSIARGGASRTFNKLTDEDVVALLPDIVKAIQKLAPSNEMFADGVRLSGLDLLSRLHIREGMELCITVIEPNRWGEKNRTQSCLDSLKRYGTHAKAMLPKLQEIRTYLTNVKKVSPEHLNQFDQGVAVIESNTATPTLVNLAEFKARPGK